MDRLLSDIRYAVRRLVRAPGFTAIAVLTLTLGIGANTAIFSVVKSVLLRPLPYEQAERLVMIWGTQANKDETSWLSVPEVISYGKEARSIEHIAAYTNNAANLTGGAEPERVTAAITTTNLFQTLGVRPVAGRAFLSDDASPAPPTVVLLAHSLWQRRFGGARDIVGQDIMVNGRARTVVGVLPEAFRLPLDFGEERPAELFIPLYMDSGNVNLWGSRGLIAIARLKEGATPAHVLSEFPAVEQNWVQQGFLRNLDGFHRRAIPISDFVFGDIRYALIILTGAVGVVLLIACANVANLMLARSDERHREIVVRTSLGASRGTLIRQLLTESVLLAVVGAILGTGLAYLATRLLVALHPPGIPRLDHVALDATVLAFTLLIAVGTGILFGLAPALSSSDPDLSRSLREGGRTGTVGRSQQRFRDTLVVAQMAFSVVLLIGAVLLLRSFSQLRQVDLGFNAKNVLSFRVLLPPNTYPQPENIIAFYRNFQESLEQLSGVRAVGATRLLPLTGTIGDWSITMEGRPRGPSDNPNGDWQVVTPGYFEAMGIGLVEGRFLHDQDSENAPLAAVVNETMAKRYWAGDPIGKRFHLGSSTRPWITIVGVVRDVHHNGIVEEGRAEMYIPHAQFGAAGANTPAGLNFVMRTTADPMALIPHVRETLKRMDPNLPLSDVRSLETVVKNALSEPRFTTMLLGLAAGLALTLAVIGIYGVIALLVTRRRQEIGIRMALGARSGSILRMVLKRGMTLAGIGVLVGVLLAAWVSRAVASMLYGVDQFDPVTFALAPVLLGAVALLACAVPAARAARVDPLVALRDE